MILNRMVFFLPEVFTNVKLVLVHYVWLQFCPYLTNNVYMQVACMDTFNRNLIMFHFYMVNLHVNTMHFAGGRSIPFQVLDNHI